MQKRLDVDGGAIVHSGCASARIAQLVEQETENLCVAGSIPAPGTTVEVLVHGC